MCTDEEVPLAIRVNNMEMLLQLRVLNTLSSLTCPEFTTMPPAFAEDEDITKTGVQARLL